MSVPPHAARSACATEEETGKNARPTRLAQSPGLTRTRMSNAAAAAPPVTSIAYEPRPPAAAAPAHARSFVSDAKLIGGYTLLSRILGLGREVVAGHYLGTGLVASAFTVAFTVPNLFRKLFGEGALSAAFIPLYAQSLKHESAEEANAFAAAGVNLLCLVLLPTTLAGEL